VVRHSSSPWSAIFLGLAIVAILSGLSAYPPNRAAMKAAALPVGTHALAGGPRHWAGQLELVPAVQAPSTERGDDMTRVYVRFPAHGKVQLADARDRLSLQVPTGTVIDRVEWRELAGTSRVIDVRGTEFREGGLEVFRAYRALGAASPDTLFGVRFARHDPGAAQRAQGAMTAAMARGLGVVPEGALRAATVARYRRMLACGSCHEPLAVERTNGPDEGPRRPTDASGLYSLLATLTDDAVLETYRPRNRNAGRAFAEVVCPPGSAPEESGGFPRCGRGVARIRVDVRAGHKAGDPHARDLCASRRALAPHLSEAVQLAYADELAACGVGPNTGLGPTQRSFAK
jgi:hypothetical protein